MSWLAHPTCQTPLGNMRTHQKKADERHRRLVRERRTEVICTANSRIQIEYTLLNQRLIVKGFTYIQRHYRAAKKGLLAERIL